DGQIFLQSDLFNAGQRPAVDVGVSVSRVGGSAQTKALKAVSGTLKISLAQYLSLESFAMFASDLDDATKRDLARVARLPELANQAQYPPLPFYLHQVSLYAGTPGYLDDIPVDDVVRLESALHDHIERKTAVITPVRETLKLDADTAEELKNALDEFSQ